MKVIYKTSMIDKIEAKIYEAKLLNKEIDKIVVTQDEWEILYKELLPLCTYTNPIFPYGQGKYVAKFKGIPIFAE